MEISKDLLREMMADEQATVSEKWGRDANPKPFRRVVSCYKRNTGVYGKHAVSRVRQVAPRKKREYIEDNILIRTSANRETEVTA